ncbi:hypothetical protein NDU88_004694 [Pleurodeles waltl]|uniref:Uncharacterized protein n=1 Tax=Pleurodeles waltl TaxID=8319 RepID=A0AAV7TTA5_PLEWA|nr:hypothetical protein NDU88_004694 [Pleurodeles waltl]
METGRGPLYAPAIPLGGFPHGTPNGYFEVAQLHTLTSAGVTTGDVTTLAGAEDTILRGKKARDFWRPPVAPLWTEVLKRWEYPDRDSDPELTDEDLTFRRSSDGARLEESRHAPMVNQKSWDTFYLFTLREYCS